MAAITLPLGPPKSLDQERLETLVFQALIGAAREIQGYPVEEHEQLIYRKSSDPGSWGGNYLPGPNYRKSIWDARTRAMGCAEAKAFTGYLWDAGALPKQISQDGDGIPGRDSWEDFTWTEHIQAPLLYLCALSATRSLSEEGLYTKWRIDPEEAKTAAKDIAMAICSGGRIVRALCPLMIHLPDEFSASLAPNVMVRAWSADERCLFLTRYHQEYLDDDATTWMRGGLLQIDFVAATATDSGIAQAVIEQIDHIKWALGAAANADTTFGEGGIILRSPSGWRGPTIRRQDNVVRGTKVWHLVALDEQQARVAADWLVRIRCIRCTKPRVDGGGPCPQTVGRDLDGNAISPPPAFVRAGGRSEPGCRGDRDRRRVASRRDGI